MTTAIFQSFNPDVRGWGAETLAFGAPEAVHAAYTLADVPGVLAAAEAAGRAGSYAAVFVAYEAAAAFDPAFQTHPLIPSLPLAWCAIFNAPKAIDTAPSSPVTRHPSPSFPLTPPPSPVTRHPSLSFSLTTHHSPLTAPPSPFTSWTPAVTRDGYTAAIHRIRDYIADGDTYQVNYTFPLYATLQGDPRAAFQTLGEAQGAGYSAYLNLGAYQLLCFSPELFFTRELQKSGGCHSRLPPNPSGECQRHGLHLTPRVAECAGGTGVSVLATRDTPADSATLRLKCTPWQCHSPGVSGGGRTPPPDSWRLTMRPMKGTAARGRFPAEDLARMRELAACEKNRAENLMILDMLRNDVGRIAVPGSVQVPRMFEVERYRTVHQMTSTVEATLPPDTGLPEIFAALFPCSSITGAPKVRTMQIIHELEPHPRGAYTGAIGLVRPGSAATFAVAIRTIMLENRGDAVLASPRTPLESGKATGLFLTPRVAESAGDLASTQADNASPACELRNSEIKNTPCLWHPPGVSGGARTAPPDFQATFGVGGGITWDSTPEGEYDECMLKAAFLTVTPPQDHTATAAPAGFDLLESLLLEDGEWFLLERHLARMRASADYFARPFPDPEIRDALAQLRSAHTTGTWKVRLLLNTTSTVHTEAQPLATPKSGGCRSRIPPNPSGECQRHGLHLTPRVAECAGGTGVSVLITRDAPADSATLRLKRTPWLCHPPGVSGGARTAPPDFWRVALAAGPVDSRDVFLFHKTTRRGVYETARATHPAADDVILWNEHGELTESCFANLVLAIGGELLTPPVECGLLAGTFRQELLETNIIRECVLRKDDLPRADAIWLINSVRRWIRVNLLAERQETLL